MGVVVGFVDDLLWKQLKEEEVNQLIVNMLNWSMNEFILVKMS